MHKDGFQIRVCRFGGGIVAIMDGRGMLANSQYILIKQLRLNDSYLQVRSDL